MAADALSRHPMEYTQSGDLDIKAYVDSVKDDMKVRKLIIEQIREKTQADGILQCILKYIHNSWPEHIKSEEHMKSKSHILRSVGHSMK